MSSNSATQVTDWDKNLFITRHRGSVPGTASKVFFVETNRLHNGSCGL